MNFRYPVIIAVLVVMIAMAISGCTSTTTTSPAVSTQPAASGTPAASSAATTAPTTGTSAPSLDFNSLKVLEYQITSGAGDQAATMDMRWEFTDSNVHMIVKSNGQTVMDTTVPKSQASGQQGSSSLGDVMTPDATNKMVQVGSESVTVPKGTFASTKYTITDGNVVSTYWIANNVPLPVKMTQTQDGNVVSTMELVDYQT